MSEPGPVAPSSVVVVGAGLAGARAVDALRAAGFTGRVTLLGAEGLAPYDRPPLSKELLARTSPAWLADELGVDLSAADVHLARPATRLDVRPDGVVVGTAVGDVAADAAVLATGARAVLPAGWDALTLHTAADAEALRAALRPGERLVVVGAGWIGAELAGVAAAVGVDVTVVEAAAEPLAAALGGVGALTRPWYAAAGVRLVTGVGVAEVADGRVVLADGEVLAADVVLAAVGARPASGWLVGALPLRPDGTVEVDARHRPVGVPPAARLAVLGDLARRRSPRHGTVPGGHWDGALRGPDAAVPALLGDDAPPPDPAPYVFSTQLGHELALHGHPGLGDDVVLRGAPDAPVGALWFRAGTDVLTAALAVDRPRDVAAARRLLAGDTLPRLDRATAADPSAALRDAVR